LILGIGKVFQRPELPFTVPREMTTMQCLTIITSRHCLAEPRTSREGGGFCGQSNAKRTSEVLGAAIETLG
jgi:hypothetical protein